MCTLTVFANFSSRNADSGNVKKKMVYSSTKEAVSKKLQLGKCFQVSDKDDMDFEEMVRELRKLK